MFIVGAILARAGRLEAIDREAGKEPRRFAHQLHAGQPARPGLRGQGVRRHGPGRRPRAIARSRSSAPSSRPSPTSDPLKRQVKALRRLGFGFAVDDAGAGYASFALVAALRPTIIKIDREIAFGIRTTTRSRRWSRRSSRSADASAPSSSPRGSRTATDLAKLRELGRRLRPGLSARRAGHGAGQAASASRCVRRHAARVPSRA